MGNRDADRPIGQIGSVPLAAAVPQREWSISRFRFFLVIAACFGLHVLLRWLVSETVGMDDGDQILRSQIWSWGYGPQPPAYTWLTKILLGHLGYSVLSMLVLKEMLMFSLYALVYAAARELSGSHLCALAATALLEANPSIAWEAHRDLTHTVLASCASVATVYSFLRLTRENHWRGFLLFGACSGLGMLAKYNFAILWVSLMVASLSLRELRPVVLNRKMLAALLLMGLICVPHFLWLLHHQALAFSSVYKLKIAGDRSGVLSALWKWLLGIGVHIGPMIAITALLLGKDIVRYTGKTIQCRLLWRMLGWIIALVSLSMIGFKVTDVRDRYIQPLFAWFPILLVAGLRPYLSGFRVKVLLGVSLLAAVVIVLASPGRVLLTERLKKTELLNTPFRKLARDLAPEVAKVDCIIGESHALAGNLKLWFPRKLVLDPKVGPLFPAGRHSSLVVWDADKASAPPADLLEFAQKWAGSDRVHELGTVEELLKYHHSRTIRLGMARLN